MADRHINSLAGGRLAEHYGNTWFGKIGGLGLFACFRLSRAGLMGISIDWSAELSVLTHTSIRPIHQWAQPTHQSDGYNNILI